MAGGFVLETKRLRLRSWQPGDADKYHEACNTSAVMRWLGGVQSGALVNAEVRYFEKCEVRDGVTFWALELKHDRRFLGFCGLVRVRELGCPIRGELEIGWRIREDAWQNGYAYEAASAVLDLAFDELRSHLIVSRAAAGNQPSRRLMRKLGMKSRPELYYQPRRERIGLVVYTITAEQWREHLK